MPRDEKFAHQIILLRSEIAEIQSALSNFFDQSPNMLPGVPLFILQSQTLRPKHLISVRIIPCKMFNSEKDYR